MHLTPHRSIVTLIIILVASTKFELLVTIAAGLVLRRLNIPRFSYRVKFVVVGSTGITLLLPIKQFKETGSEDIQVD